MYATMRDGKLTKRVLSIQEAKDLLAAFKVIFGDAEHMSASGTFIEVSTDYPVFAYNGCEVLALGRKTLTIKADGESVKVTPDAQVGFEMTITRS